MAKRQRSVRSAKGHDPARRGQPPTADVSAREPASAFYARVAREYGSDLELDGVIRENRKIDPGPEL
jgi:hypothetical protein